ncbi:MAG: hypothetical protein AABO58_10665 [Acidobacteriota bacterium]
MTHIILTALALMLTTTAAQGGAEIPDKFWSTNPYRTAPLWISARAALDHETLRSGALAEHEAAQLRNHLRQMEGRRSSAAGATVSSGKCDVTFGALLDDAPMPSAATLDDVRRYASTQPLVEGTVVGSDVGLYAGTPFTVVQIRVTRTSKSRGGDTAYLLIPKGTLTVEGVALCTSDPRYSEVPANGDTVLFVAGLPANPDGTLFRLPAEHLFVWHGGALVVVPRLRAWGMQGASLPQVREMLARPDRVTR